MPAPVEPRHVVERASTGMRDPMQEGRAMSAATPFPRRRPRLRPAVPGSRRRAFALALALGIAQGMVLSASDGASAVAQVDTADRHYDARVAYNRGDRLEPGNVIDDQGEPTTDPRYTVIPPFGALLPFGEYKGFGLSLFAELLGGALTGGGTCRRPYSGSKQILNGMLSILIDPGRLGTARHFADEAEAYLEWLGRCRVPAGSKGITIAGDPERAARARTRAEVEREAGAGFEASARPTGVTNMLPGCGSAWKKPSRKSWSNMTVANCLATAFGSMPAASRASRSLILMAVTSARVSTRRVVRSQTTSGAATRGSPAKAAANRSALDASCR